MYAFNPIAFRSPPTRNPFPSPRADVAKALLTEASKPGRDLFKEGWDDPFAIVLLVHAIKNPCRHFLMVLLLCISLGHEAVQQSVWSEFSCIQIFPHHHRIMGEPPSRLLSRSPPSSSPLLAPPFSSWQPPPQSPSRSPLPTPRQSPPPPYFAPIPTYPLTSMSPFRSLLSTTRTTSPQSRTPGAQYPQDNEQETVDPMPDNVA